MPLSTATIGRKTLTIIVSFLLLGFLLGLASPLFKGGLNNLSPFVSSLGIAAKNFILLLISMAIVKKQFLFEPGEWKRIAIRLTIINLVVVAISTLLATASVDLLYKAAYPIPHTNELTSVVTGALLSLVETTLVIYIVAWLVLRKPNVQV